MQTAGQIEDLGDLGLQACDGFAYLAYVAELCPSLPTRVFKAAWPGAKKKWPAAYEIIKGLTLTVEQQQPLMGAVDVDGNKAEDVAKQWFVANEAVGRPIVGAALK